MFFGPRKRHRSQRGVSPPGDPASDGHEQLPLGQWQAWRLSAQNVTRSWNEWLAAGSRQRDDLYDRYVCALAEEERAAIALEHTTKLKADPYPTDGVALRATRSPRGYR